jgi:hypothetical protein
MMKNNASGVQQNRISWRSHTPLLEVLLEELLLQLTLDNRMNWRFVVPPYQK